MVVKKIEENPVENSRLASLEEVGQVTEAETCLVSLINSGIGAIGDSQVAEGNTLSTLYYTYIQCPLGGTVYTDIVREDSLEYFQGILLIARNTKN